MIELSTLQNIIADNREFVKGIELFRRDIATPDFANCVAVGLRRAGKSYWLFQVMHDFVKEGEDWENLIYINFESERLIGFELSDFNRLLEAHYTAVGSKSRPILFLDEIQIIDGWEKFARRMADEKITTFITGSNAKMLSTDVASLLGGRYFTIPVTTLTFAEYLRAKGLPFKAKEASTKAKARLLNQFMAYLHFGGFPETVNAKKETQQLYLENIFQTIYLHDIMERSAIKHPAVLRMLLKKIAESVGQPLSYSRLTNLLAEVNNKISKVSTIAYVDIAKEACLLHAIPNYAGKLAERESVPKYYFADTGLLKILSLDCESAQLENLVAIELLRRFGRNDAVFYYKKNIEVDFYVPEESLAIQVAYNLRKNPETIKREVGALEKFSKAFPCQKRLILTLEESDTIDSAVGKIEVCPVFKWLLAQ